MIVWFEDKTFFLPLKLCLTKSNGLQHIEIYNIICLMKHLRYKECYVSWNLLAKIFCEPIRKITNEEITSFGLHHRHMVSTVPDMSRHTVLGIVQWLFYLQVAEIFSKLESMRSRCHVEDYSVTQTSLDHVFIRFARQQTDSLEEDGNAIGSAADTTSIGASSRGSSSQLNLIV